MTTRRRQGSRAPGAGQDEPRRGRGFQDAGIHGAYAGVRERGRRPSAHPVRARCGSEGPGIARRDSAQDRRGSVAWSSCESSRNRDRYPHKMQENAVHRNRTWPTAHALSVRGGASMAHGFGRLGETGPDAWLNSVGSAVWAGATSDLDARSSRSTITASAAAAVREVCRPCCRAPCEAWLVPNGDRAPTLGWRGLWRWTSGLVGAGRRGFVWAGERPGIASCATHFVRVPRGARAARSVQRRRIGGESDSAPSWLPSARHERGQSSGFSRRSYLTA